MAAVDETWIAQSGLLDQGLHELPTLADGVRCVESPAFGRLWAPGDLPQLAAVLQYVTSNAPVQGWRGQADIRWPLDSSAVRRLIRWGENLEIAATPGERSIQRLTDAVDVYERELLNEARLGGHDKDQSGHLTDLELLASLQHYGAATRLLDFTLNAMLATWFASESALSADVAGILLGIFEGLGYPQPQYMKADWLEAPVPELLAARPDQVLLWRPRAGHDRMLAQQSLLAVAAISDNPWGSFGFHRDDGGTDLEMAPRLRTIGRDLFGIAIPPALKDLVREASPELFGYTPAIIFPDLAGFGRWHASTQRFDPRMTVAFIRELPEPRVRWPFKRAGRPVGHRRRRRR